MTEDAPSLLAETAPEQAYRVLARKYRPQNFSDLIGQDAMVQILTNAFRLNRLAQGYMLTGVRGIGKTTTARLIARALNYKTAEVDAPTIAMTEFGEHCEAILEGRHPDVIEMDAASNTGVDNMREIIEAVRYRPLNARYKVYIIDEVHMLSKSAFNALLKTLEEPPPHVKFIFATTEIRKVPVTVLSRCQRFDLRRLSSDLLVQHFGNVAEKEGVTAEAEALRLIARASEGSVRDGLSLLDQAIAFDGKNITAQQVQSMLGLADRARVIDLFAAIMKANVASGLDLMRGIYEAGGDPVTILTDLADFVHWVTRLKVIPSAISDASRTETEKTRGQELATSLSMAALTRAWQMLLKGLGELRDAPDALAAAEMLLIRLAYAAEVPSTSELVKKAQAASTGTNTGASQASISPSPSRKLDASPPAPGTPTMQANLAVKLHHAQGPTDTLTPQIILGDFKSLVALVAEKRDIKLKTDLERFVRPVRMSPGKLEIALEPKAPQTIAGELSRKLEGWTGQRWMVLISREQGEPTLAEQEQRARNSLLDEARNHEVVKAIFARFPQAEIKEVREPQVQGFEDLADPTNEDKSEDRDDS